MEDAPILIVGGNSGIGFKTVERLKNSGRSVVCALRNPDSLKELDVPTLSFDATKDEMPDLPEKLSGLVYFPGTIQLKPFHRFKDEDFLSDFEINCMGAVKILRAAMKSLKASGNASVVMFSTVAVNQGLPFHASVGMAKAAVEGLTRSLAAEWAPTIRVNAIAPSLTDTPLAENLLSTDEKREASAKRHPLQDVGKPEDVASLVAFLLSEDSRFMTGQILRPDGGMSSVRTFG